MFDKNYKKSIASNIYNIKIYCMMNFIERKWCGTYLMYFSTNPVKLSYFEADLEAWDYKYRFMNTSLH
jgi:hypothetical protein